MTDANDPYVQAAREAKARKIADLLAAHEITAESARGFNQETWSRMAQAAGVHRPSGETQMLVIRFLEDRERATREAQFHA